MPSTLYWQGTANAVAQVRTATWGTYDATTTRKIAIGGVVVSAVDSGGSLTAALTAFAVVLNASTEPYFAAIAWTSTATTIVGTAKTAGVPFTFTGSVSGGTGTHASDADTIVSSGPNHLGTIANWYTAAGTVASAIPQPGDIVYLTNSSVSILWDLDQTLLASTGGSWAELHIDQTFTGAIGLDYLNFTTSASTSGSPSVSSPQRSEYRPCALKFASYSGHTTTTHYHGESLGLVTTGGCSRCLVNYQTITATVNVLSTPSNSTDSGRPCLRLLGTALTVNVRNGIVGIAAEQPNETSTAAINCSDQSGQSKIVSGYGFTLAAGGFISEGGTHLLRSNATIPLISVSGGSVRTEGSGGLASGVVLGGTLISNATGVVAAVAVTTGTFDCSQSLTVRHVSVTLQGPGAIFKPSTTVVVDALSLGNVQQLTQVAVS